MDSLTVPRGRIVPIGHELRRASVHADLATRVVEALRVHADAHEAPDERVESFIEPARHGHARAKVAARGADDPDVTAVEIGDALHDADDRVRAGPVRGVEHHRLGQRDDPRVDDSHDAAPRVGYDVTISSLARARFRPSAAIDRDAVTSEIRQVAGSR